MISIVKKIVRKIKRIFQSPNHAYKKDGVQIAKTATIDSSKLGSHISIGHNNYIYKCEVNDFTYLAQNVTAMNTVIGKFCAIGQGVNIGIGDHPTSKFVSIHPAFFSPNKQCGYSFTTETLFEEMGENSIGNDVHIGANVFIRNNVKVGNGAIIGAGAVVVKDVPDYAIVAGVPAKIIKYRFNKKQIEDLLKLKWWDMDYVFIEENYKEFLDVDNFLNFIKNQPHGNL